MTAPTISGRPLPQQHRNPVLRKAIETAVPGYVGAERVADQAQQLRNAKHKPADVRDHLQTILDTGHLPEDFLATIAETQAASARTAAVDATLSELHLLAVERMTSLLETHCDNILAALHTQLVELVDEARDAVDELLDSATPEEAIAAGHGEAWQRLQSLWSQHQLLRSAQSAVMHAYVSDESQRARSQFSDVLISDLTASNWDELLPGWRRPIAPDSFNFGGDVTTNGVPWPDGGPAAFVWLIRNARLWVPTRRELRSLWARRAEAPLSPRTNPKPDVSREAARMHRKFAGRTA